MNIKKMSELQFLRADSREPYIVPSMIRATLMSTLTARPVLYADNPDQRINSTYVFLIKSAMPYEKLAALVNFINKMLVTEYQPQIIILFAVDLCTPQNFMKEVFQDKLYWKCSFSYWCEWTTGKFEEQYHEIVKTLTAKVPEQLSLSAALIEEMAVAQLLVETLGQINIFSLNAIPASLYYLRDFWTPLTNNVQNRYWRPFQCFQVTFSKTVKYPANSSCLPYFFESNEGNKLIITRNAIYLEMPNESLNQQPWAIYLNSIMRTSLMAKLPR